MSKGLVTKACAWAVECRRLAWAVLKLIYREMELPSKGASAATESPIGDSQDALRQTELVCPSATDAGESSGDRAEKSALIGLQERVALRSNTNRGGSISSPTAPAASSQEQGRDMTQAREHVPPNVMPEQPAPEAPTLTAAAANAR